MLQASKVNCTRCPLSCKRKSIVDGSGRLTARLMVVDSWPGREEDKAGVPQLGEGGRLLRSVVTDACSRLGVDPAQVWYTYAVRCRPSYGHDVTQDELEACLPWLVEEFETIRPKCVLTLGKVADGQFLNMVIASDQDWIDGYVVNAYSPNYILKNKSKLPLWAEQVELAVRRAFDLPSMTVATHDAEPWTFGSPDLHSQWLSADTEFDTLLEEYGSTPVGYSMSDGIVSDFFSMDAGPQFVKWPHLYLHNIRADADHLGLDLHDLDSWDDTMLMAYCTRRFSRVGLKVIGPLLTGLEW